MDLQPIICDSQKPQETVKDFIHHHPKVNKLLNLLKSFTLQSQGFLKEQFPKLNLNLLAYFFATGGKHVCTQLLKQLEKPSLKLL